MRKTKLLRRIQSLALFGAMVLTCLTPVSVYAADYTNEVPQSAGIERAGVETLPEGQWYDIGSFSFTDSNVTPVKTVPGEWLTLGIQYEKASYDAGSGPMLLTIRIMDYYTGEYIATEQYPIADPSSYYTQMDFYMGYAGRKIQIRFELSSTNGSTVRRSAKVNRFCSYVTKL